MKNLFKGFDDWIEIFLTGKHTDSAGKTRTWTRDDLNQAVNNHSTDDPAPAVLGHPEDDSPAYGWTGGGLKELANMGFVVIQTPAANDRIDFGNKLLCSNRRLPPRTLAYLILEMLDRFLTRDRIQCALAKPARDESPA